MSLSGFLHDTFGPAGHPRPAAPARTAPRVRVAPLHDIAFGWTGGAAPLELPVANLSATGLALMRSGLPEQTLRGPALTGQLRLGARELEVALGVVHVSHVVVGCCFLAPGPALVDAINAHLATELLALEMRRVEEASLAHHGTGSPHWFHGRESSELYYVEQGGEILRFRLSFLGNYLEGGPDLPVRFGVVTRDRQLASSHGGVHWFRKINAEQLGTTIRFVSSIPGLDPAHRDGILKLIC